MYEIKNVQQHEGEFRRRWFYGQRIDLLVWLTERDEIVGFQLCYDELQSKHALTWFKDKGYQHNLVDEGDKIGRRGGSPILLMNVQFEKEEVSEAFKKEGKDIDERIAKFVYEKIMDYNAIDKSEQSSKDDIMEEKEYKDNEKVLYKTRCKVRLLNKELIETDCLITESHVVINTKEPIKIPLLSIDECYVPLADITSHPSLRYQQSTHKNLTLLFTDDQNKKQKLSLEIKSADVLDFDYNITKIKEKLRRERENLFVQKSLNIRPWVRYWARSLDYFLFAFLTGIIIGLLYPPALEISHHIFSMIILCTYIFVEAFMLASWGSTPGKALLRVHLKKTGGNKLSYSEAFKRALKVWIRGLGLGIPIVSICTLINANIKLNKEGITSWDQEGKFLVTHQDIGAWRIVVTVLIFIVFFTFIVFGEAGI